MKIILTNKDLEDIYLGNEVQGFLLDLTSSEISCNDEGSSEWTSHTFKFYKIGEDDYTYIGIVYSKGDVPGDILWDSAALGIRVTMAIDIDTPF